MKHSAIFAMAAALMVVAPTRSHAGQWPRAQKECSAEQFHSDDLASYAETREQRLAPASTNTVDPGENGSVRVYGWKNGDVLVRACIQAAAPSESEARSIAGQVAIARGPGDIQPQGPTKSDNVHWNVSYEVWVPNTSNLEIRANNGSIRISDVNGQIRFRTLNGSVHLTDIAGDVEGATTNGSINIQLAGSTWNGHGLRAQTTNGSVHLKVPENYSANVETSTVNGRLHIDFPIEVSGDIGRSAMFQLGQGGPTIEAKTVNGSVNISHGG